MTIPSTNKTTKRTILKNTAAGLTALALLAVTAACGKAESASTAASPAGSSAPAASQAAASTTAPAANSAPVKVRFGLDTAAGGSLQFREAAEQGYFKKYGVDPEISNFAYGIDTINALLVQRTDTAMAADYALLNSLGKGDMKVVSALTRATEASSKNNQLLARNAEKPEDLKGKKLGVARGTVFEYIWAKFLEKEHWTEKDVKLVYYTTPDEAIVALTKGEMDAVWASGALLDKFLKVDGVKAIGDLNLTGVKISGYQVVEGSFLKKNAPAVTNFLKAVQEGITYVKAHNDETAELAFRDIKLPKDGVLKDLKTQNYVLGFTQEDYDHLQDMKTWMEQKGILKDKYDLKEKLALDAAKAAFPDLVTYSGK